MIKIGVDPDHIFYRAFAFCLVRLGNSSRYNVCCFWAYHEINKGARISYDNLLMAAIVGIPTE